MNNQRDALGRPFFYVYALTDTHKKEDAHHLEHPLKKLSTK